MLLHLRQELDDCTLTKVPSSEQIHKLLLDAGAGKDREAEYKNGLPYGDAKKRLLSDYMDFILPFKTKKKNNI